MRKKKPKGREMANKKVTKTATKKAPAKKPVARKNPVKSVVKANAKVRKSAPVVAAVTPKTECGCGCGCCCHRGQRLIGFCIKVIILCMVFLLGCLSAPWFMKHGGKHMMPEIAFDENGCVVLESVKCPKLLENLATADNDADGCITRMELKEVMHDMHK